MPLDVPETPHLAARMSRYWSHPLYPTLATASLSNITVSFPHLCSLQLTVDRLAPYCSSLYTGASLCPLYPTRQHWDTPTLWALSTSPHAQDSNATGLHAPCLGYAPFFPPLYRCSLALPPTLYCPVRLASGLACSSSPHFGNLWALPIVTPSSHAGNTTVPEHPPHAAPGTP